jgi:hypothetical protein
LSLVPITDGTLLAQVKLNKSRVIFSRLEVEMIFLRTAPRSFSSKEGKSVRAFLLFPNQASPGGALASVLLCVISATAAPLR